MALLTLLAAAALLIWLYRRPRGGRAGGSAAARARQLRTPMVRLAELAGVSTTRGRTAAQYEAGAEGERRTGRILAPLRASRWTILHDRALPTGRANVDHLVISPRGVVILVDSKRWDARFRLRGANGRLLHGDRDVTDRLRGLHHEVQTVSSVLGVPVIPLVVMHGAPVAGELVHDGVRIVPADRARPVLRGIARQSRGHGDDLGRRAARALPPYRRR